MHCTYRSSRLVIKITAADSGAWHTGAGLITAIYWEMTMTDATLSELSAHLNQEPVPRAESESIDYEHEPSRRCVGCRDTLQGQGDFAAAQRLAASAACAVTGRQAIDRALVPGLTTRQVDGFGAKRAVFGPAKNFTINMQRDERQ